ncbi:MAG: hypothetical protein PSV13_06275 [Lacunisphaera sp.]|nr:hypothetical protein [Lacunisphaera sp.]
MSTFDHQWQKLTALARSAPVDPAAAPFGFATRVAARAATAPAAGPWAFIEHFALRGLVVAAVFGMASAAFNYSILTSDQTDIYATGTADSIVELLDIS